MPARNARILDEQGFHDENDEHRVLCGERIRDEKIANICGARRETVGRA